ncbi:DNA-binding transcriptional LysR family regulator [Rhodoligotrophos appendicifer]|uniref:LysR family transcriptional regulator n=1 Tax=Rhodoligotrophos appendicifer TaxID=987056 RepID=UPI001185C1D2|nr:LysR family transcriptional regulator [Rhodoligotrophos appendicifer]
MRLDIDSLRTFKAVLETGGVTRAARLLNLTQSAVSHKLARLEDRIGRPILVRSPTGVEATVDGLHLLHYAERLVALHDEATDRFRLSEVSGEMRLGATEDAAASKLAAVLGRFRRSNPRASLAIRVGQSLVLQRWLETAEVDIAVMQIFADQIRPGDVELWREDLVWVQSADHPVTISKTIPFVSFDSNCFYKQAAMRHLADSDRSLTIVLECPSVDGVRSGVRNGLGVALLSRRNITPDLIELEADLPEFPKVIHVLRSRNAIAGELELTLSRAVVEELKEADAAPSARPLGRFG